MSVLAIKSDFSGGAVEKTTVILCAMFIFFPSRWDPDPQGPGNADEILLLHHRAHSLFRINKGNHSGSGESFRNRDTGRVSPQCRL
jgi:hypothetical protein